MNVYNCARILPLIIVFCVTAAVKPAQAYPDGIVFVSGSPAAGNCTGCHSSPNPTPYNYSASLVADDTLIPRGGSTGITFSIARIGLSPIPRDTGLNVAVPGNGLDPDVCEGGTLTESSSILKRLVGQNSCFEITHTLPQPSNSLIVNLGLNVGLSYAWPEFTWTAPAQSGVFTVYACGNLVNGSRQNPLDGTGWAGDNPTCTTLNITVNDPPVITQGASTPVSMSEDSSPTAFSLTLNATDVEDIDSTLSWSISSAASNGTAGASGTGASKIITYTPTLNYNGSDSFNVRVTDSNGQTAIITVNVTITSINDVPVLSGVNSTPTYSESDPPVVIDATITGSDVDTNCNQATIDLSTGFQAGGEDILAYAGSVPGISAGAFNTSTGTLTLSGVATCVDYATALEFVTYENTSSDPNTATRTVDFQLRDTSLGFSAVDSTTITVAAISFQPVVSNVAGTTNYNEDTNPGVVIDNDVAVADPDSTNCNSATVDLSTNYQSGQDLLEYTTSPPAGISVGAFNSGAGSLTLSASPAVNCASFGTALQGVRYRNNSNAPSTSTRTVTFQVLDSGNTASALASKQITVTASNDTPVANNDTTTVAVNSSNNSLNVMANDSDPDGDSFSLFSVSTPTSGGTAVIGAPCAANRICYTPPADFTGDNTFTYTIRDPSLAESIAATVTIGGTDTDGDGVIDHLDNCDNVQNAGQQDNDGDGNLAGSLAGGDACDTDDDNDGMADVFENTYNGVNGCALDPFDASDATEDCDGDGRNNLEESQTPGADPTVDDVGPVISGVQDITLDATGYLTPVSTGSIGAVDVGEGLVVVNLQGVTGPTLLSEVQQGLFRPGRTRIERSAQDSLGNITNSTQTVDVRPLADFAFNQVAVEGGSAAVEVFLNGEPPDYPVTFDYSLSGSSTEGSDYNVVGGTGTITIDDPSISGLLFVDFADDGPGDNNETLVLTLSNPVNAVLGNNTTHRIRIAESNVAPIISFILVDQAGPRLGPQIIADNGSVNVFAQITDPNLGDTFTYSWNSPFGTSTASNLTFSSNGLTPGSYPISLQVTDSNGASTSHELAVKVLSAAPVLSSGVDADGDGIEDDVDGFTDDDMDGIPNYLDAYETNIVDLRLLQNQVGDFNGVGELENVRFLQTDPGLFIRKGPVAMFGNASGALVGEGDVMDYADANGVSRSSANDHRVNIGGIFDFEIYNMPVGATARVVLPLSARILEGSTYRKFSLQDGWRDFSTSGENAIASARGTSGACPAPGDSSYSSGLNAFDNCIELTLVDGGPNDADGEANGAIRDPGGVAVTDPSPGPEQEEAEDGSGGGVLHPLLLLLLMWGGLRIASRQRSGVGR
jgi:hypothetical protein